MSLAIAWDAPMSVQQRKNVRNSALTGGGLGAAVATLICIGLRQVGFDMPDGGEAALATVITYYFVHRSLRK